MPDSAQRSPSRLLEYLPAIYREDPFPGQFLLAFEKVLLGRQDDVDFCYEENTLVSRSEGYDRCYEGLAETIAGLATLFDPRETKEEFLPWLAKWAAFTLRADLDIPKQRDFIARIIQLYRWRRTKKNLQDLLAVFTVGAPTITEISSAGLQVGVHATIGRDTYIGGGPPHYFHVAISLPRASAQTQGRQLEIARALIDLEKPAHTHYDLDPIFPSMQIGKYSTVGVDTLLGTATSD